MFLVFQVINNLFPLSVYMHVHVQYVPLLVLCGLPVWIEDTVYTCACMNNQQTTSPMYA